MRASRSYFLLLLVVALSRAPAAGLPAPPAADPAPAARARAVMARKAALVAVGGRQLRGGSASTYTAYFDGEALRLLEERRMTPAGPVRNAYCFEHGALYYYTGQVPADARAPGPGGRGARVTVEAEFHGAEVLKAVSVEHYGEVTLGAAAVADIRSAAAELAAAALRERQAHAAADRVTSRP